jgi:hypothetical protein
VGVRTHSVRPVHAVEERVGVRQPVLQQPQHRQLGMVTGRQSAARGEAGVEVGQGGWGGKACRLDQTAPSSTPAAQVTSD